MAQKNADLRYGLVLYRIGNDNKNKI